MSSGPIKKGFYETDDDIVVKCNFQPETESFSVGASSNVAPAGPAATGFPTANISKGRRTNGINTRLVRFKFDTPPAGYQNNSVITLPIFTKAFFATVRGSQSGTYDIGGASQAVTIVGTTPEKIK